MNWINIEVKSLRAPEYVGSDPSARAAWIGVLAWCCEQENGGRIANAAAWGDRRWQQTCGATLAEVNAASPLLTWDGPDLVVWNYPISKENEVKAKREQAKAAISARWDTSRNTSRITQRSTCSNTSRIRECNTEGEGERERNENENKAVGGAASSEALPTAEVLQFELEEQSEQASADAGTPISSAAMPVDDSSPVLITFKCNGKVQEWHLRQSFADELTRLYPGVDVLAQARLALAKIEAGVVTRKTAGGMNRFLFGWMDRASNSRGTYQAPMRRASFA